MEIEAKLEEQAYDHTDRRERMKRDKSMISMARQRIKRETNILRRLERDMSRRAGEFGLRTGQNVMRDFVALKNIPHRDGKPRLFDAVPSSSHEAKHTPLNDRVLLGRLRARHCIDC